MLRDRSLNSWWMNCWVAGIDQQHHRPWQIYAEDILYDKTGEIFSDVLDGGSNDPWNGNRSHISFCTFNLSCSLFNVTTWCRLAGSRRLPGSLDGEWQCLNLPSHFFPSLLQQIDDGASAANEGFLAIFKPRRCVPLCLSACPPDSHGLMIDCSPSAFVLGNCFVLLTVCLCSSPDRRDSAAPFFAYLPNMFQNWIEMNHTWMRRGGDGGDAVQCGGVEEHASVCNWLAQWK